ncbi:MAG: D-alanyl-D-alanine carboxypeptidase family protein [Candidatus Omnitrophota bacterium]
MLTVLFKKNRHALGILIFLCFFAFTVFSNNIEAAKGKSAGYSPSAQSVIFSDSTKVKRLYGKNVDEKVLPASTTKVMTALLVLEHLSLDKIVTIGEKPPKAQPSKILLKPGERYRVADLLLAAVMSSANDASIALAEAVAGSEWKFVQMMNQRAKELGCKNTKFANASGLPTKESQYTTAYDMYVIFLQALKHNFFKKALKHKTTTIRSREGRRITLKSHNKILFMKWRRKLYGKTGYTRKAGSCFVGYIQKGRSTLVIAIFNCASGRRWQDIKYIVHRYGHIAL